MSGDYLQTVANDKQKTLARNALGNIQVIDKGNIPEGYTQLEIDKIVNLTLGIFESSTGISKDDRVFMVKTLGSLGANQDVVKALLQVSETDPIKLLRDFAQEVPPDLAPEAMELLITTLLKDETVTSEKAYHATIYTMSENAAQKYLAKGEVESAFRVRMLIPKHLRPALQLSDTQSQHIGNLDTSVLKNGALYAQKMVLDGEPMMQITFKVNHPEREKLNTTLSVSKSTPQELLQSLPKDFCDDVQVVDSADKYFSLQGLRGDYEIGSAIDIRFGDAGFIRVGTDSADDYMGGLAVLYDLKPLERGGYAFAADQYGSKKDVQYRRRANLVDFTRKIQSHSLGNEVMIKNRIPPQYIKGFVVQNEEDKTKLINALRKAGKIEERNGEEFIIGLDVLATDFIHISPVPQEDMWGGPDV